MYEGGGLLEPISTVCLCEIVRYRAGTGRDYKMNTVKTVLKLYSKHYIEILVDPMKKRLQEQDYTQFLRSIHVFFTGNWLVGDGYTSSF